ncbi:hypothetical protein D0864_13353 [Hortaea werneckii]|uniref:Nuclear pore complex component n=1 Tax=Hortaea werneckii TaxID=91943 RepID=A0A3M7D3N7_HORWE|nr:hypothetical protein KC319_g7093 [Hortaea werneckii]KAI7700258.1 hypothetical protein KC322_g8399 [Hortaea werneckii]RMY58597.1 hypothetical protein D0864_13353 [Hortaea werneckii]
MATTLTRTTSSPRNTASLLGNTLSPASRSPAQPQANTSPSPLAAAKSAVASVTPSKSPTPGTPTQQPSSPALSTPGAWQHPRMDEVLRRRDANRVDKSHMQMIALNLALLILTFLTSTITRSILPRTLLTSPTYQSTTFYTHLLLRAFLTLNIALSLAPLFRPQDPCDDIPLTDSQRYHLGLPPRTRPATPMEEKNYVTPPRYSRNSTPQSDRASLRLFASDSPLGTRSAGASPLDRSLGGSPFASSSQRPSPLGGRQSAAAAAAAGMNSSPRRRSSFQGATQRGSPLGGLNDLDGFGSSVFGGSTGTPTKSNGATTTTPVGKASVGLNSKWLYEKGLWSPRSGGGSGGGSGFAGFGGGGSVFT